MHSNNNGIIKSKVKMGLDNNQFNIIIIQTFRDEKYNKLINIAVSFIQIDDLYPSPNYTY